MGVTQSVRDRMRTQLSMRAPLPLLTLTFGALCLYVCVPSVVTTTPAQWHRMAKGGLLGIVAGTYQICIVVRSLAVGTIKL